MSRKKIYDKLDELYVDKKSRTFMNHIVKNYFPLRNAKLIDQSEVEPRCCISREKLNTLGNLPEENQVKGKPFSKPYFEEHAYYANFNKRGLAVTGGDSNTYMSYKTYVFFYDWVVIKALTGDKHMGWLLRDTDWSVFMDRAELIDNEEVKKRLTKEAKVSPITTYALGDMDVLRKLKESFN